MVRYPELDNLARDSGLSANLRIALSMESWDAQSRSGMNEEERILSLEELWMGEKEHKQSPADARSVLETDDK